MRKNSDRFLSCAALGVLTLALAIGIRAVSAQENISFPVKELGNCADKASCKIFCDRPENSSACLAFAKQNGLMSQSEIDRAEIVLKGGGPGGCDSKDRCDAYCNDMSHLSECIAFAEKSGILPPQELAEAKNVMAAIAKGVKPPPCNGKKACDAYCTDQGHMDECVSFSVAAGLMTADEAAMARKTGGKGPGGCKGKEECDAFCKQPQNDEMCFGFGLANGMIPQADLQRMEEGKIQMSKMLNQAPVEITDCVRNAVGESRFEQTKNGTALPTNSVGQAMKSCFEKFPPNKGGPGSGSEPGSEPIERGAGDGKPGSEPNMTPGTYPNAVPGMAPGTTPGAFQPPNGAMRFATGTDPNGSAGPRPESEMAPGTAPGTTPGTAPQTVPGTYQPPAGAMQPVPGMSPQGDGLQGPPPPGSPGSAPQGPAEGQMIQQAQPMQQIQQAQPNPMTPPPTGGSQPGSMNFDPNDLLGNVLMAVLGLFAPK